MLTCTVCVFCTVKLALDLRRYTIISTHKGQLVKHQSADIKASRHIETPALCVDVRRNSDRDYDVSNRGKGDAGVLKDAIVILTSAQRQYSVRIGEWSAPTLKKEITKRARGWTLAPDELRLKH